MSARKPPSDVPPSELFLKLLEPQPSEVMDFPRKDRNGKPVGQIRIRVLSQEEHDMARVLARADMKARGFETEDLQSDEIREVTGDQIAKELIAMACLDVNSHIKNPDTDEPVYGRVFTSAREVGKLRAPEVSALFRAYMLVQDKFGPTEHDCDVDAWVNRLAEGGQSFPLLSQDLPELASLTCSLAEKISFMCLVLGSQWEELPPTCQSALEPCCSGIGSWLEQRELPVPGCGESSPGDDITIEDAVYLDRSLREPNLD